MATSSSLEKSWFVLSLVTLAFLYGTAVGTWEWFPHTFLDRAVDQARAAKESMSPATTMSTSPQVYDREGVRMITPEKMQSGLTLLSSAWKESGEWEPELRLVNEEGEMVHKWRLVRDAAFQGGLTRRGNPSKGGVHGSYLFPNGDVLLNLEYVGTVRLDACGEVLWTLEEGNHHSIARADDGSFWIPGVSSKRRSTSEQYPDGFPGLDGKSVWLDRILHVSEEGQVIEKINVLDLLYENDLERYIPKALGGARPTSDKVRPDLTHLNDVEPLPSSLADEYPLFDTGDLAVSLRSLSLAFVFDPESRDVKWHASEPFIYQHDPDFLGNGWIGVFDNNYDLTERGTMLGGNRIVALQPHTDSVEVRFPTPQSESLYTDIQGKWQEVENGNMLLTESQAARAVEVDSEGRTVWEWTHAPTENSRIPSLTKASRHDLPPKQIAAWPCSSVDTSDTK